MTPKENLLAAIRFESPQYVPLTNEDLWYAFQLGGNFRAANWTDAWGVQWEAGIEGTAPFPKGNPLKDLSRLDDYKLPVPDALVFTEEQEVGLASAKRDGKLVCGLLYYLLFERAWSLMGMDNFMLALASEGDRVRRLLHMIAEHNRRVFARYLDLGVDAISFSEDLGTQRALMISPTMFRELFLPEYRFMFADVLAAEKMINFHSCGCVDAVAGDLAEIGVTILNPIQARANDLARIKSDTLARMALQGGIDTALLVTGKPADIRREVIRVMEVLKPGGGYLCGPDQSMPGIPQENMDALWQTAREVGRY